MHSILSHPGASRIHDPPPHPPSRPIHGTTRSWGGWIPVLYFTRQGDLSEVCPEIGSCLMSTQMTSSPVFSRPRRARPGLRPHRRGGTGLAGISQQSWRINRQENKPPSVKCMTAFLFLGGTRQVSRLKTPTHDPVDFSG